MRYLLVIILLAIGLFAKNDEVVLQFPWKHQFQFAGFYVAKEMGFYNDAGLDVNIKEYDNSINVVDDVVSQKATYGVGKSTILIDRTYGKPIVALSAIYQSSPSVLVTTNPYIKIPSDLLGKKIMVADDTIKSASIIAMLTSNSISRNNFIIQKPSFDYNDLIKGTTDAMACYLSNEPYYLKKNNIPYRVFDPKEYGYDSYSDIVFTSERELKNNPQRVRAFNEASKKGWLWAFENIEKSAKLIYEKYNTQNKSLESLIFEGEILKKLALIDDIPFGNISRNKFAEIAKVYQLNGFLNKNYTLDGFIDPLALNKSQVKIGVLAKRGKELAHKRWDGLAKYLNKKLDTYDFRIVPLNFTELEQSVKNKSVDFVITNTMYYVQLESKYGISRIATLINNNISKKYAQNKFGGVIFTRSDNKEINTLDDLDGKSFGAVNSLSFGGWIMAYEELLNHELDKDDIKLEFFDTHDAVVHVVLASYVDAGTVRTDTLERMAAEGLINLSDIKVLEPKKYDDFPFVVSTKLYPEWPFAKLQHTPDTIANKLLAELVSYIPNSSLKDVDTIDSWTAPLDYSSVHVMLKKLQIDPYHVTQIKLADVFKQYALSFYLVSLFLIVLISRYLYIRHVNKYLNAYNLRLDNEVKMKTQELSEANKELEVLANTDFLTGISNRAHFMKFAEQYFNVSKRNGSTLQVLSLDLDYFKTINDTHGHQAGDDVLQAFTKIITALLRKSDLFGRIGGEEFSIVLQNTSLDGMLLFAERVRKSVEAMKVNCDGQTIHVTVSIGVAELTDEKSIEDLMNKSDRALYKAKENGRNQVYVFENK